MNVEATLNSHMTVNGTMVTIHACQQRPNEEIYNYKQQYQTIVTLVERMFSANDVVPIYIQGQSGSGKTVLANVLKENGNNVELIDVCSLRRTNNKSPSNLITNAARTYLVDEADDGDVLIINKAEEHAKKGGLIIFFIQDICDIGKEVLEYKIKPKYLELVRGNLTEMSF